MKYNKPPLTIDEQIDLLRSRGMIIRDPAMATAALESLSYYRLSAYWLPFEKRQPGVNRSHSFINDTTFEKCYSLYQFDVHLRQICFAGIKRVELALRTQFALQLSIKYGSHFYLNPALFHDKVTGSFGKILWKHIDAIEEVKKAVLTSREVFIKHYLSHYTDPYQKPPIWMVVELLSIGDLSRWYKNLKSPKDRQCIANFFSIDESLLVTAIHHFSVIRNICAHHARLWNRELVVPLKIPKRIPLLAQTRFSSPNYANKIHNSFVILAYLLKAIDKDINWMRSIKNCLNECPLPLSAMGFETGWEKYWPWCALDEIKSDPNTAEK
jgi:abortive infection bacteriophage resistance protein